MNDAEPDEPAATVVPSDPYGVPDRRKPSDSTFLVNGVRADVDAWRANGYPGVSPTTQRLLAFWFDDEHRTPDDTPFQFFFCQREAVETFIYLAEVERVHSFIDLLPYASQQILLDPNEAKRARLAFKMATGSGKTLAMSLCITWAYFHALHEADSPMSTSFLVLAPNVIVFERLKSDFGDTATFRRDPLIPPEWADDFEMTVVLQDDPVPVTTRGVLFLTNIQRLYEARANRGGTPNPVEAMVGPRVDRDVESSSSEELFDRIAARDRVMVINDEAHHVWSERLMWNQTIERLHASLRDASDDPGAGVVSQLDFSATPKDQRGNVFRHVVVDYPLAQAVADGIVKTPLIGETTGGSVELGDTAVQKYRQWIDVAVGRWKKFHEALSPAGKRPVLFVMCANTQEADEVADYLRQRPEFSGDRLLIIHTTRAGEIVKRDLDIARQAAREIDGPDSPIRCIVSVLMLREGWDVRNVCVILTLRSLTARAQILPEQALGRGLRRMTPPGSGYDERVVVVEHDAFRHLWDAELDGGLRVDRQPVNRVDAGAITIFADEGKKQYDIEIPQLSRVLTRAETPLDNLDPADIAAPAQPLEVPDVSPDEYIEYRGLHLIDNVEVERDKFHVPYAEDPSGAITYYTKSVARAGGVDRIAGSFAALAPMVRDYLQGRVFDRPVDLADKTVLKRLAENDAQQLVVGAFEKAIRELTITERDVEVEETTFKVSDTPAFPWSRKTAPGEHTVFNLTPIDSALEGRFAQFLDRATDVAAYAKLTMNSRFGLEYISSTGALRYYYPDFVIRLSDDTCLIVETKGLEDIQVALKDRRARRWCRDATELSGREWDYEKVLERPFDAYTGDSVDGLRRFIAVRGGSQDELA
ncbi:MAG: DEAD/DEAH box helicase family protein [Solirubrobacterales bacterium]